MSNVLSLVDSDAPRSMSMFLKNAVITQKDTEVQITCEFSEDYPESSCVLIYRGYNDAVLTVIEYPHTTTFPVSFSVDRSKQITFSVFGKNKREIDILPCTAKLIMVTAVAPKSSPAVAPKPTPTLG